MGQRWPGHDVPIAAPCKVGRAFLTWIKNKHRPQPKEARVQLVKKLSNSWVTGSSMNS